MAISKATSGTVRRSERKVIDNLSLVEIAKNNNFDNRIIIIK